MRIHDTEGVRERTAREWEERNRNGRKREGKVKRERGMTGNAARCMSVVGRVGQQWPLPRV